jgi:hypothetical protein
MTDFEVIMPFVLTFGVAALICWGVYYIVEKIGSGQEETQPKRIAEKEQTWKRKS